MTPITWREQLDDAKQRYALPDVIAASGVALRRGGADTFWGCWRPSSACRSARQCATTGWLVVARALRSVRALPRLAHLPHTLGTDAVFADLARAARAHPAGGALLEWRSAAACTHGRLRPDGYGLLRLGPEQHGFFLEFDRGSMRPGRLRSKFAAYVRYRASGHAARTYDGFPVLLVVRNGPGAEQRLVRVLRAAEVGQSTPLPALLTTTALLEAVGGGPLGCVWRTVAIPARRKAWE